MLRTDDGSIRGTIKKIEHVKLHNLQQSKHRGDGARDVCHAYICILMWLINII